MARRSSRAARAKPAKAPRERKGRTTEVEVVEEQPGLGWETGVAILTGILILVAILITDWGLGKYSDAGIFF
jgi:hypothetical protein